MKIKKLKKLIIMLMLSVSATARAVETRIDGLWYNLFGDIAEGIYYKNFMYEYKGDIVIPHVAEQDVMRQPKSKNLTSYVYLSQFLFVFRQIIHNFASRKQ